MSRVLAIDYGAKRCGIAVSDPLCIIANPVDTVQTTKIIEFLTDFFSKNQVSTIVVGKPIQMNGTPSQCWDQIQIFTQNLQQIFPTVQIKFVDERFTSKLASAAIAQSGLPKHKRESKALIDKTSAVIILQSYLEYQ